MFIRAITVGLAVLALTACNATIGKGGPCQNQCSGAGAICDPAGSGKIGVCTLAAGCYSVTDLTACTVAGTTCTVGASACVA